MLKLQTSADNNPPNNFIHSFLPVLLGHIVAGIAHPETVALVAAAVATIVVAVVVVVAARVVVAAIAVAPVAVAIVP